MDAASAGGGLRARKGARRRIGEALLPARGAAGAGPSTQLASGVARYSERRSPTAPPGKGRRSSTSASPSPSRAPRSSKPSGGAPAASEGRPTSTGLPLPSDAAQSGLRFHSPSLGTGVTLPGGISAASA